jgi:hypothetical protein
MLSHYFFIFFERIVKFFEELYTIIRRNYKNITYNKYVMNNLSFLNDFILLLKLDSLIVLI